MKRLRAALFVVGSLLSACGGTSVPVEEQLDFSARSWPENGPASCGDGAAGLSQVRAINKLTVEFTLCSPDVAFLQKVALSNFTIQDSGYLRAHAADGSIVTRPNGTGALSFSAWEKGSQIVLKRFESYWGDKAAAESVVIQWQPESSARLLAIQAGTADGIDSVGTDDVAAISTDPLLALYPREALNTMYLGMNHDFAPFDDVRVRQAIAIALNRERIVDTFYPAGSTVATHFTPCVLPGGCAGDPWGQQDVVLAKTLLAEAGYPNGFSTTIEYRDAARGYLPVPTQIATDIQDQLRAIGVRAELQLTESATYLDRVFSGAIEGLFLWAWVADFPDASNFIAGGFGDGTNPALGSSYPTLTALVGELQGASINSFESVYARINSEVKVLAPMVPIAHGGSAIAFRSDVTGAHASPLFREQLSEMRPGERDQLIWIQPAEPAGLYCADEFDTESMRVCIQIGEALYGFMSGTADVAPQLATECVASDNQLTWTCTLRDGVLFHNGATLDASDVVDTYAAIWDCSHPYHAGRTNAFAPWVTMWSTHLNPEACAAP